MKCAICERELGEFYTYRLPGHKFGPAAHVACAGVRAQPHERPTTVADLRAETYRAERAAELAAAI